MKNEYKEVMIIRINNGGYVVKVTYYDQARNQMDSGLCYFLNFDDVIKHIQQ